MESYGDAALHHRHRLLAAARSPSTPSPTPTPGSTRASSPPAPTPTCSRAGRPVRRLPPAAQVLRGPVALAARHGLDADADGARRGPPLPPQRGRRRRGSLQERASTPSSPAPAPSTPSPAIPSTRFYSETNPGGVRCSILDLSSTSSARGRSRCGRAQEKAAGRGSPGSRSPTPVCLRPQRPAQRAHHAQQFVDLNEKLGGLDLNADPTAEPYPRRPCVDRARLPHRADQRVRQHLDQVAMINHCGPDPEMEHDYTHAVWTSPPAALAGAHRQPRRCGSAPPRSSATRPGPPRRSSRWTRGSRGRGGPLARCRWREGRRYRPPR